MTTDSADTTIEAYTGDMAIDVPALFRQRGDTAGAEEVSRWIDQSTGRDRYVAEFMWRQMTLNMQLVSAVVRSLSGDRERTANEMFRVLDTIKVSSKETIESVVRLLARSEIEGKQ